MNFYYLQQTPPSYDVEGIIHFVLLTAILACVITISFLVKQIVAIEMDTKRINKEILDRSKPCK